MANSPPEKRRCTKDGKKDDTDKTKNEGKDGDKTEDIRKDGNYVEETERDKDDNDDAVLLSQAMDDGGMKDFFFLH